MKVRGHYTDWAGGQNTGACGYYRIHMPCRYNGWSYVGRPPLSKELVKDRYHEWLFDDADVLLTQYVAPKGPCYNFLSYCRERNKAFIIDLDDNYLNVHDLNPAKKGLEEGEMMQLLKWQLSEADGLLVTRDYLKTVYEPFVRCPIFVIPNYIEPIMYPPGHVVFSDRKRPRKPGQVRVGWAGGYSHEGDFQQFSEAMIAICRRHPHVTFVAAGYESFGLQHQLPHYQWEFVGGATPHHNYTRLLWDMDLDIAVAPLLEHEFNRSKSAIRVLENGMCGYAVIASKGFDLPYQEVIKHGQNGLLATSRDEWEEALDLLIHDEATRRIYSRRLREDVERDWSIQQHAGKWQEMVSDVAKGAFEPSAEELVRGM